MAQKRLTEDDINNIWQYLLEENKTSSTIDDPYIMVETIVTNEDIKQEIIITASPTVTPYSDFDDKVIEEHATTNYCRIRQRAEDNWENWE